MRFDVPADRAGTASFEYEVCGARGGPDNDDDRHDQRHRWQWILEKLLRYYGHGRGGGQRRCDRATVSVRVDRAPVVDGELVQTFGDVPVRIEVLANDFDPDAGLGAEAGTIDPGSVRVLAGPSSGTTVVDADGVVTYSPAAGFVGVDGFDYEVCDGLGLCGSSSVTVGVADPSSLGVARDDDVRVDPGGSVVVDVLVNDDRPPLDPGAVSVVSGPSHGSAVVNGDLTVTYTPEAGFAGVDAFGYQLVRPGPVLHRHGVGAGGRPDALAGQEPDDDSAAARRGPRVLRSGDPLCSGAPFARHCHRYRSRCVRWRSMASIGPRWD